MVSAGTMREVIRSTLRNRLARQAGQIYVYQGASMAAGLVTSILVARSLGPSGKGILDLYALLPTAIVELGLLGLPAGLLFILTNRRVALGVVHGDTLVVASVATAVGTAIALLGSAQIADLFGGMPQAFAAIGLVLAGVVAYVAIGPNLLIGIDRAPAAYRLPLIVQLISTGLMVLLWLVGWVSVAAVFAVTVGSTIGTALLYFVAVARAHRREPTRPTRGSFDSAVRYGLKIYVGSVANWIHFRADQLMVANMVGVAGVGLYALSVRWAEMLWLVGFGVLNAGLYRIASSDRRESRAFTWRLFILVLGMTGGSGVVLAILAMPLISLLYGGRFDPSAPALILLIPGVVAWDAARVLSNHLSYNLGRPLTPVAIAVTGSVANLLLNLVTIPRFGIAGAAAASSVSYVGVCLATLAVFLRSR